MSTALRRAANWSLFADWCAAAELSSLPAEPATVAMFLEEISGGTSTQRERLTAIRERHAQAGLPDPSPTVVQVPDIAPSPALGAVLSNVVVNGWPGGLAGCRDGFLLVMFGGLRLTRRQLQELRGSDIDVSAGRVAVHGRHLVRTELPGPCPVCAVTRWLRLLHMVEVDSWYEVRMALAGHWPEHAADQQSHHCLAPLGRAWRRSAVLIPAVDRYGSVDERGAMALRSITAVTKRRSDAAAEAAGTEDFSHSRPYAIDPDRPAWTRAATHAELAKLDPVWDQFEQDSDAIAARIEALLAEYDR